MIRHLFMLLVLVFINGCVNSQSSAYKVFNEPFNTALSNFRYEKDIVDERRIYARIDQPFYGDCEDFAFTLQRQIGGHVWYVRVTEIPGAHAVLVKDGIVYDYIKERPVLREEYKGRFFFIMNH